MKRLVGFALTVALATNSAVVLADPPAPLPKDTVAPRDAACAVSAEVVILHATNDGTGIDPKLGKMPELSKPPFSSYNSYRLHDTARVCLAKGKGETVKLPTGRDLQINLKEVIEPTKRGEARRFVVSASIQKPDGKTFLPLLEVNAKAGENFFVAGQTYKGGILVIGIKLLN